MKLKSFLPLLYGCHQRSDRSFSCRGKSHLLCARCEGILIGHLLGAGIYFLYQPELYVFLLIMLPMGIDGMIQYKTAYESTNRRRLWTGFLFGLGSVMAIMYFLVWSYHLGNHIRELLF